MAKRPQTHLADVVRMHGTGDATAELREIMMKGLFAMNEQKQAERLAEKGTTDKLNPYVSDAGKCGRAVTFSLMNVPESDPLTADSLMNFLVGRAVEEAWAQILIAQGAEFVREEKVRIPAGITEITGRKDFTHGGVRLLFRSDIVELKSINSRAMGFMLRRGDDGRDEHRRQLNLYLEHEGAKSGYLVYIVKDATKGEPIIHAYHVAHSDEQVAKDRRSLVRAFSAAKAGTPPPIPEDFSRNSFPCSYCGYRKTCWDTPDDDLVGALKRSLEAKGRKAITS